MEMAFHKERKEIESSSFFTKATLEYFPTSDRNQGVDYTSTEMDLHFGRIIEKNGKATIKAIDYNRQADEEIQRIYEEDACKLYYKWENVKRISKLLKKRQDLEKLILLECGAEY